MCGRIDVVKDHVEPWVRGHFNIAFNVEENRDLSPSQLTSVVALVEGKFTQLNVNWGIQPAWSKKLIINAKAETVQDKENLFSGVCYESMFGSLHRLV